MNLVSAVKDNWLWMNLKPFVWDIMKYLLDMTCSICCMFSCTQRQCTLYKHCWLGWKWKSSWGDNCFWRPANMQQAYVVIRFPSLWFVSVALLVVVVVWDSGLVPFMRETGLEGLYIALLHIYILSVVTRDHSFPLNVEFWAEPWNLPVSAEFPCFRRILRYLVLAGNKGTNTAYFGRVQAAVLYEYMILLRNTWVPLGL